MKKFVLGGALFLAIASIWACAANKADEPQPISCTTVNVDSNTYTLAVKPILDANCATFACHSAVVAESNVNMSAYAPAVAAFQNKDALCTIQHSEDCIPMPDGQAKLADSLITIIQCWAENGYKE